MSGPDYTSLVPHYTFAETLAEQEAQLADNPLLQRMIASRKAKESDPHRPVYHYVNPENTLNDPNGLCFWQGRWHLFYQGYPPDDPRQHWGHAISDDLIHWRDLPYAIYPDPEESCFSGAALVEDDRVIAMYHGTQVGNMVAVSSDPLLLNWEKVTGQAGYSDSAPGRVAAAVHGVRSLHLEEGRRLLLPLRWDHHRRSRTGRGLRPISSSARRTWRPGSTCTLSPRTTGSLWWGTTAPVPTSGRSATATCCCSSATRAEANTCWATTTEDRDKLVVTSHGLFNFGPSTPSGVHAPSATPDGQGGIIVIFNMNSGFPTEGWNQIMTLPRRLTLAGEDEVRVAPAGDIESLRYEHRRIEATELPANEEVVLEGIEGSAYGVDCSSSMPRTRRWSNSTSFDLRPGRSILASRSTRTADSESSPNQPSPVRCSTARKPAVQAHSQPRPIEVRESLLTLDTSYSSTLPGALSRAPETAPIRLEPDEPLQLRVFIDHSVVEVFANGKQCVAARVYPGRRDSTGVSLRAQGSPAELRSLDAWKMRNIYV